MSSEWEERAARGSRFGRPGRARELLDLLDEEQPERSIAPLPADVRLPGYHPGWRPRARAKCQHPERWAKARGLCDACYQGWIKARDPESFRETRQRWLSSPDGQHAKRRRERRRALGLLESASEWEVRSAAQAAYRKRRAAAIRRARAADSRRMSNYRTLRLDLGDRVDTSFEGDQR